MIAAVAVGHLGVQAHRDVRRGLDLPDQVVRHRPGQAVAPHQHRHQPGVPGQVQRGLAGRVPRAHHEHVAVGHGPGLGPGRAKEHAGPDQRLQPRHGQPAPRDAGRDDRRLRGDLTAVGQAHDARLAAFRQADGGLGEHHVRAEDPGLLARPAGELVPADPVREAGVIADHRAVPGLAAGDGLLQHDRLQPLGRGVDGRGEAGRPGTDDDQVTLVHVAARAAAGRLDDLRGRRPDHRVAVVADHDRQQRAVEALAAQQLPAALAGSGIEPERHVEPGDQLAQLVRAAVVGVPDDLEQVEPAGLVLGPFGQELADQPVEVRLEQPRLGQVIVGLAQRDGRDHRAARRVVTIHQQHPLGQRVPGVGPAQEVGSGHVAHVVAHDQQGDGVVLVGEPAKHGQARRRRVLADHAEICAEPAGEILPERVHDPRVVIDHEQHRLRHQLPPSPRPTVRPSSRWAGRLPAM